MRPSAKWTAVRSPAASRSSCTRLTHFSFGPPFESGKLGGSGCDATATSSAFRKDSFRTTRPSPASLTRSPARTSPVANEHASANANSNEPILFLFISTPIEHWPNREQHSRKPDREGGRHVMGNDECGMMNYELYSIHHSAFITHHFRRALPHGRASAQPLLTVHFLLCRGGGGGRPSGRLARRRAARLSGAGGSPSVAARRPRASL